MTFWGLSIYIFSWGHVLVKVGITTFWHIAFRWLLAFFGILFWGRSYLDIGVDIITTAGTTLLGGLLYE